MGCLWDGKFRKNEICGGRTMRHFGELNIDMDAVTASDLPLENSF